MQQLGIYHIGWLVLAVLLEILANIFLKYSQGFRKVGLGIISLLAVLAAFSALGQAIKGMDLAVAYALWGGFGVIATVAAGWILFGQKLNKRGGLGLICLLVGMVIIKLA